MTLERDYLLSWGLTAISQMPTLCDMLVFKGGTALRKCYFGDYRFSEDLDFSALAAVPTGDEMEQSIRQACEAAVRLLDEYAPVEIACERYTEREPHPGGKEAFTIRARFPWQSRPQTRVMIEVTVDERVLRPPEKRRVIHEYGEPPSAEILVYPLEEIVAEKLRALLQQAAMFEARGWKPLARPRLLRPLARARCFVRSAPSGASPSQARTNSSTTVCLPSSRRPGNSGSAPSCWTCLHSRRGLRQRVCKRYQAATSSSVASAAMPSTYWGPR